MGRIQQNDPLKAFLNEAGQGLRKLSIEVLKETFSYLFATAHLGGSFAKGTIGELLSPKNDDEHKLKSAFKAGLEEASHKWAKYLTKRERASFKRGTAAISIIGTGVILNSMLADEAPRVPTWPDPDRRQIGREIVRTPESAPIENFKYPERVLFLTVGDDSGKGFVQTYRNNENFQFSDTRAPIISGTFSPNNDSRIKFIFVDVNRVSQQELLDHLNQNQITPYFQAIFYRGHTYEMESLVKFGTKFEDKFCFSMMGGCNSAGFISKFHTSETPTAGVDAIGYGARNNYWNVLTLQGLSSDSVSTWGEFKSFLEERSRMAQRELILPGTERYVQSMTEL